MNTSAGYLKQFISNITFLCNTYPNLLHSLPSFLSFSFFSVPFLTSSLLSFSIGVVPEQANERQTAETLLAVASPSRRPTWGAPYGPCLPFLHLTVPLHPAPPPTSPPPPSLSPGSLLTSILSTQSLQLPHEDPGCPPPLSVPQQTRGATSNLSVCLHQCHAPSSFMPLPPLPALGTRTSAQS